AVPAPVVLNVNADKKHCLSNGPLMDDTTVVNPKNQGLKTVFVYFKPEKEDKFTPAEIHPTLVKVAAKEVVIDQPCCQFIPRAVALRGGDTLVVKNSSPVAHNVNFSADDPTNDSFNSLVPSKGQVTSKKPLVEQRSMMSITCNIHPWMSARAMAFDHPYFAVTDEDGKFEIKMLPETALRIFYRHENGYHTGKNGAKGFALTVKGDNGVMTLPALNFVFPPAK
ncbi:MAG: hypothetical protein ACRCZF_03195, partial [Gemmataceae bacterium]